MNLFTFDRWPLQVICLAMILSAVIDWWKFKVPNWLTLPVIVAGWLLGAGYDIGAACDWWAYPEGFTGSRILASLACTALGFLLLFPMRILKAMGGGDVKMQMGFGAWVGAYFGPSWGPWVVLWGFVTGVLAGGIIGLGIMVFDGQFGQHMQNLRNILSDTVKAGGSLGEMQKKADERKGSLVKLPYGVPLCIGFLAYLYFIYTPS